MTISKDKLKKHIDDQLKISNEINTPNKDFRNGVHWALGMLGSLLQSGYFNKEEPNNPNPRGVNEGIYNKGNFNRGDTNSYPICCMGNSSIKSLK